MCIRDRSKTQLSCTAAQPLAKHATSRKTADHQPLRKRVATSQVAPEALETHPSRRSPAQVPAQ
eukprot:3964571-Alexandrium_andersonii.AAC.1